MLPYPVSVLLIGEYEFRHQENEHAVNAQPFVGMLQELHLQALSLVPVVRRVQEEQPDGGEGVDPRVEDRAVDGESQSVAGLHDPLSVELDAVGCNMGVSETKLLQCLAGSAAGIQYVTALGSRGFLKRYPVKDVEQRVLRGRVDTPSWHWIQALPCDLSPFFEGVCCAVNGMARKWVFSRV